MSDEGALALAGSVRATGRIRELFVQGLDLHHDGLDALVSALPYLPELRRCVLGRARCAAAYPMRAGGTQGESRASLATLPR